MSARSWLVVAFSSAVVVLLASLLAPTTAPAVSPATSNAVIPPKRPVSTEERGRDPGGNGEVGPPIENAPVLSQTPPNSGAAADANNLKPDAASKTAGFGPHVPNAGEGPKKLPEKPLEQQPATSAVPDPTPWLLLALMLAAGVGFWRQHRAIADLNKRVDRMGAEKDAIERTINDLNRKINNRPAPADGGRTARETVGKLAVHTTVPAPRDDRQRSGDLGFELVDHEPHRPLASQDRSAVHEAHSSRAPETTWLEILPELQHAAEAVMGDTGAVDSNDLTAQVAKRISAHAASKLRNERVTVGAHNASSDLSTDFSNPNFISVIRHNGHGWLLPHRRVGYAFSFRKYYIGEHKNWPTFSTAALCRADSDGKILIVEKGTL